MTSSYVGLGFALALNEESAKAFAKNFGSRSRPSSQGSFSWSRLFSRLIRLSSASASHNEQAKPRSAGLLHGGRR